MAYADPAVRDPGMIAPQIRALIWSLAVAAVLFAGWVALSEQVTASRIREDVGLTRGSFLDRHGVPIVSTVDLHGAPVREYRLPSLTPFAGYRDSAGHWHGLEQRYDSTLSARGNGAEWSRLPLHLAGRSTHGSNVRLTIDSALQTVAARALGPHPGGVVALDPSSGAVLALVSSAGCAGGTVHGARRCDTGLAGDDRALTHLYAPGSTFKIVTLTAAIDSGRYHLDDYFSGVDMWGPSPYFDNSQYPSNITRTDLSAITLKQALAFSDNFTFAHIGLTLGSPLWLRYAHRYGLDRPAHFDVPVARSTVAYGRPALTARQLAQASFGAPVDRVTVLQMALVAATVANGGVEPPPHVVQLPSAPHNRGSRVMSRRSAATVAAAMKFVVDLGSGTAARIHGVAVAGKTGTAAGSGSKPDAWFIAFAPVQHPVIALAVVRQNIGEGADWAAPIARAIIVQALREHGYHIR